ncbi:MAG: hypothetical protein RIR69_430 [Actinomycetota bacterium]
MSAPSRRFFVVCLAALTLLGACSSAVETVDPGELEFVGRIPGVVPDSEGLVIDGVRTELPLLDGEILGPRSGGNKVLIIGDSIFAATTSRYGGAMCSALVPLGWRVAVEAESGQMVNFGRTVLRDRINEGWDAAVVFLGTNFSGNQKNYEEDLTRIVDSLAPRPTLLLTATLFRESMKLVNESIRTVAAQYPNVAVLDWGAASLQDGVLNKDKIHPTDMGRKVLVAAVSSSLGNAPKSPGACLPSKYVDDSLDEESEFVPTTTSPNTNQQSVQSGNSTTTTVVSNSPASTTTTTPSSTISPSSESAQ